MSTTRCQLFNLILLPLAICSLSSIFWNLHHYELLLLRLITVIFTLIHIHYAVCVVRQMTEHFGIYCFKLGKREQNKSPELENLGKKLWALTTPHSLACLLPSTIVSFSFFVMFLTIGCVAAAAAAARWDLLLLMPFFCTLYFSFLSTVKSLLFYD